jgi:hypothetical protein
LALLLHACAQQPVDEGRRELAAPAAAPAVMRPPSPVPPRANLEWTFESGSDECVATARAAANSLGVTVRRGIPIRLVISLGRPIPAKVAIRFAGSAGGWQALALQAGKQQLAVDLGPDETALSRLLVLLSGGTMDVGGRDQAIISLTIPPSDGKGQLWFDCARNRLS